jgi:hypothetical protein
MTGIPTGPARLACYFLCCVASLEMPGRHLGQRRYLKRDMYKRVKFTIFLGGFSLKNQSLQFLQLFQSIQYTVRCLLLATVISTDVIVKFLKSKSSTEHNVTPLALNHFDAIVPPKARFHRESPAESSWESESSQAPTQRLPRSGLMTN